MDVFALIALATIIEPQQPSGTMDPDPGAVVVDVLSYAQHLKSGGVTKMTISLPINDNQSSRSSSAHLHTVA